MCIKVGIVFLKEGEYLYVISFSYFTFSHYFLFRKLYFRKFNVFGGFVEIGAFINGKHTFPPCLFSDNHRTSNVRGLGKKYLEFENEYADSKVS